MAIRIFIGPAGSGKTHRCVADLKRALAGSPDGPSLLFLTPKQNTFQIERQVLASEDIAGFTRVQILSFERLANFISTKWGDRRRPELLDEPGRVMVVRSILSECHAQFRAFARSARTNGFASEVSQTLREIQQSGISVEHLRAMAGRVGAGTPLHGKLMDLALILDAYENWLRCNGLADAESLLPTATECLKRLCPLHEPPPHPGPLPLGEGERQPVSWQFSNATVSSRVLFEAVWLDGFAQLRPAQIELLTTLLTHCGSATLAFCTTQPPSAPQKYFSSWHVVQNTVLTLMEVIDARLGITPELIQLPATDSSKTRFTSSPVLAQIASDWGNVTQTLASPARTLLYRRPPVCSPSDSPVRIIQCSTPEEEAIHAARTIRRFVLAGGRYREASVITRSLGVYHEALQRAFARYEIPFFIDRRQPIAHHPLAELTRGAMRMVALEFQQQDVFAILKTGLCAVPENEIDLLENVALEFGWSGDKWLAERLNSDPPSNADLGQSGSDSAVSQTSGLHSNPHLNHAEHLRQRFIPPFLKFHAALLDLPPGVGPSLPLGECRGESINGAKLATAIRQLWDDLHVSETLERWNDEQTKENPQSPTVHPTVWAQMSRWLENVELAFANASLTLRQWLPILDSGLSDLSIGVIPPVLDEVLIGAVDRSRNPEIKLALLLGFNDGTFPAPPPASGLLSEEERSTLAGIEKRVGHFAGQCLRPIEFDWIGRERYYGYIALTRASNQVIISYSRSGNDQSKLNPSPFIAQLKAMIPSIEEQEFSETADCWFENEHAKDLAAAILKKRVAHNARMATLIEEIKAWRSTGPIIRTLEQLSAFDSPPALSPAGVERLYGKELKISVTEWERFAACPFQFLIRAGFRARERKYFEADHKELGSFQHHLLRIFHEHLEARGMRWRDLKPDQAVSLVRELGEREMPLHASGLFDASDSNRHLGKRLIRQIEELIRVTIEWMEQNQYDPIAVELRFDDDQPVPAWRIPLKDGRAVRLHGVIDRLDVFTDPAAGKSMCVVIDYKARGKKIEPIKVENFLQAQPPAYLLALIRQPEAVRYFKVGSLSPTGMFYVPIRGKVGSESIRSDALDPDPAAANRLRFQYSGLFDQAHLPFLDKRIVQNGDQFKYRRKNNGDLAKPYTQARPSDQITALLHHVEQGIAETGELVLSGVVDISPFRKGTETACDRCDYKTICRFDPVTHPYRSLKSVSILLRT